MKKMHVLKKLSLFISLTLLCNNSLFSQNKLPVASIDSEWNFFQEVKGIKFYVKREVKSSMGRLDVDYLIFKLENTSNKDLDVSYSPVVYYNLGCNGCNSNEFYRNIVVPAHSSIEGNLSNPNFPVVMLLSNPNLKNGWIPESIETRNLTVN